MSTGGSKSGGKKDNTALFEKNARNYRIGGDIQPKRDLTRFVKWPKYVRVQRQKRILLQRLKVPPTINQFSQTINKDQGNNILCLTLVAGKLLNLLSKYKPESKQEKKERLQKEAESKDAKKGPKPVNVKYGLNHITTLVENGSAKLVVVAHDVDPLELVLHLPALCRKQNVPFCIVKGKARLGRLVGKKTATAVALTEVKKEDYTDLENLCKSFRSDFNDNESLRRKWGGGIMGIKNVHKMEKRQKRLDEEFAKKANM